MFNPKDVMYQARDKKNENVQWIQRETELRQAFEIIQPRKKVPKESVTMKLIEILRSLLLLKRPKLGHKLNR